MWIIEHFNNYNGLQSLAKELKDQGVPSKFIDCCKGEEYTGTSAREVLFFGSQQLGEKLRSEGKQGLFLGHDKFLSESYLSCPVLLNQGKVLTIKNVEDNIEDLWVTYPQGFFIRPNSWKKLFQGQVLTKGNFAKNWSSLKFYLDNDQEKVIVSPLKTILKEYRILYIKGEAVTGSSYVVGEDNQIEVDPTPFKEFIEGIKDYLPEDTCAIDISETPEGLKLIEFNPLSTSAIYKSNPVDIIKKIR